MAIGIYKIENLINHKKYIGQSRNIERRWKDEKQRAFYEFAREYDYPISRALRKYGLENFSFSIIEECPIEKLNERERYWINYYNTFFEGYNQTLGGEATNTKPKEKIIGIVKDLENTDMPHREIAEKWDISIEMVQGINTGRYWHQDNRDYPIQKRSKRNVWLTKNQNHNYCESCGIEISKKVKLCLNCCRKQSRVVDRPDREKLKSLIREKPFTTIAKDFGVSDNSIRKWCDAYNLPRKKTEIKKFSDLEWSKI